MAESREASPAQPAGQQAPARGGEGQEEIRTKGLSSTDIAADAIQHGYMSEIRRKNEQAYRERLERAKSYASRRLHAREHLIAHPTAEGGVEAKDWSLMDRSELKARNAYTFSYTFSNYQIRVHVFKNWLLLDDFFYRLNNDLNAICSGYPVLEKSARQLRALIEKQFSEVKDYAQSFYDETLQMFTERGLRLADAEKAASSDRDSYNFVLTAPMTNLWLREVVKLDTAAQAREYLSFEGVIPIENVTADVQRMVGRLLKFSNYIYLNRNVFMREYDRLRNIRQAALFKYSQKQEEERRRRQGRERGESGQHGEAPQQGGRQAADAAQPGKGEGAAAKPEARAAGASPAQEAGDKAAAGGQGA